MHSNVNSTISRNSSFINTRQSQTTRKQNSKITKEDQNAFLERKRKKQVLVIAALLSIFSILLLMAMLSYTAADEVNTEISFKELVQVVAGDSAIAAKAETTKNWLGIIGAIISHFLYNSTFGYAALLIPIVMLWWAKQLFQRFHIPEKMIIKTFFFLLIASLFSSMMGAIGHLDWFAYLAKEWSGSLGQLIANVLNDLIGSAGTVIVCSAALGITFFLGTDIDYVKYYNAAKPYAIKSVGSIANLVFKIKEKAFAKKNNDNLTDHLEQDGEISENNNISDSIIDSDSVEENNNGYNIDSGNGKNKLTFINNNSDDIARIISSKFSVEINRPGFDIKKNPNCFKNNDPYVSYDEKYKENNNDFEYIKPKNTIEYEQMTPEESDNNQQQIDVAHTQIFEQDKLNNYRKGDIKLDTTFSNETTSIAPSIAIDSNDETEELSEQNSYDFNYKSEESSNEQSDNDYKVTSTNLNEDVFEENELLTNDVSKPRPLKVTVQKPEKIGNKPVFPLSTEIHDEKIEYKRLPLGILVEQPDGFEIDEDELNRNAQILQEKLETFKIYIENLTVTPGPVVTQYEFVPAPGIKISRIESLADDIAMALKARGIRIIAPVPGKGTVGIEIPNQNPSIVRFSSIVGNRQFYENDYNLPLALGKTISGEVYSADLSKMPHLLIAGSTGTGKSVGINTIICSLLFKLHPSQLKFVIIDPKKVEMTYYAQLRNHYLAVSPDIDNSIITSPDDAVIVLNSLCSEMDNRYSILSKVGQRNINDYNQKVRQGTYKNNLNIEHREIPYIVVIIDELADLMLTAGKEVETPITRLAQLARAVGIHLVVATQRPSVDVITGIIKSNFPARMSYLVASKIDSRTILDLIGAEKLLGNGDMLFLPGGYPKPLRIQNSFISTDEVEAICNFIGNQEGYSEAYVLPSLIDKDSSAGAICKEDRDPLFEDSARLVIQQQIASVSLIQRRMKVGYARAGRIIDELEDAGIVGPFDGSKARQVLLKSEDDLDDIL